MSKRLWFHVIPEGRMADEALSFQGLRSDWEAIAGAMGETLPAVFTGWPSGPKAASEQPNVVWPQLSETWRPPAKLVELGVMLPTWERWIGEHDAKESRKRVLGHADLGGWYRDKASPGARAVIQVPLSMAYTWVAGYEPVVVLPEGGPYRDSVRTVVSWAWERCDTGGVMEVPF